MSNARVGGVATQSRLQRPEAHALRYVVPRGQDPAILTAALVHAGYRSVGSFEGGTARVLIACDEQDRGTVRDIIRHVDRAGFDGPDLQVARARFEDER
jgi:hypothetical protein